MVAFVMSGGACLGLGWVFAGFRKKDKLPKGWMAAIAAILLLGFSASMFLLPVGRFFVNVGSWLVELATGGAVATLAGSVCLFLVAAAFAFMVGAVVRDFATDSKADGPTFIACAILWIFAGIAYGAIWGPIDYDVFTADLMRRTVEGWS